MTRRSPKFRPPIGTHYIAEIYCRRRALSRLKVPDLRRKISHIVKRSGFTELGRFYFKFKGGGITGIVSLQESHIAFHTWPEYDYLTLDIYTCNYTADNAERTGELFSDAIKLFTPVRTHVRRMKR